MSIKPLSVKPGDAFILYKRGNPNRHTAHVRAIVDGCAIVYAHRRRDGSWTHEIAYYQGWEYLRERGSLKRSRATFPVSR